MKLNRENKYKGAINLKVLKNVLALSIATTVLFSGCSNSENIDKKVLGFSYTLSESESSYHLTSVVDISNLQHVNIYLIDKSGTNEILLLRNNIYKDKSQNIHFQMLNVENSELLVDKVIILPEWYRNPESLEEKQYIEDISEYILNNEYGYRVLDHKNITYYIKEMLYPKSFYTADEITELIKQIHDNYYSNNSLNVKYKVLNKK